MIAAIPAATTGETDDPRNDDGRKLRPLAENLFDDERREAQAARLQGRAVFRDPREADRVWVLFDWDDKGWASFVADPEVPPIMKAAGHKTKAQAAPFAVHYSS